MIKLLRWIAAFPIAFFISGELLILLSGIKAIDQFKYKSSIYFKFFLLIHATEIIFAIILMMFLTCAIVPVPKKIGVLISAITIMALTIAGIYISITNPVTYGDFTITMAVSYISSFIGVLIAVILNYYIFRNRGWNRPAQLQEISERY